MPFTPLGRQSLEALFGASGRVALANRASGASGLRILDAVIVRHDAAGGTTRQVAWDLDLAPGEAESLDALDASEELYAGIELLLRLFYADERGLREIYLASPPDSTPARQWDAGVRLESETAQEREFFVPESPGLVAYLRALD